MRSQMLVIAITLAPFWSLSIASDVGYTGYSWIPPNDPLVIAIDDPAMESFMKLSKEIGAMNDGRFVVERDQLLRRAQKYNAKYSHFLTSTEDTPALNGREEHTGRYHKVEPDSLQELLAIMELGQDRLAPGRPEIQQVRDPETSIDELLNTIEERQELCRRSYRKREEIENCRLDYVVPQLENVLDDLRPFTIDTTCASAAREYKADIGARCPDGCVATGARFDDACLQSLLEWRLQDGSSRKDPLPSILIPPLDSADSMIALIERVVDVTDRPYGATHDRRIGATWRCLKRALEQGQIVADFGVFATSAFRPSIGRGAR